MVKVALIRTRPNAIIACGGLMTVTSRLVNFAHSEATNKKPTAISRRATPTSESISETLRTIYGPVDAITEHLTSDIGRTRRRYFKSTLKNGKKVSLARAMIDFGNVS